MRIAVLGTGVMARTTAAGLARAGHDVLYGSRHPDQHTDLDLPVAVTATAAESAEIVVNALDGRSSLNALTDLRAELSGRILVDVGNAVDENFDLIYTEGSLGERLQRALPETRVVKTLSTMWGEVAVDPHRLPAPSAVFLSGDDADAKATVAGVLRDLGWADKQQFDLGDITTAKAVEHYFVFFTRLRLTFGDAAFNIAVVR